SKMDQIRQTKEKIQQMSIEKSQQFKQGKTHYLWGQEYILSIEEKKAAPSVRLDEKRIILTVSPETDAHKTKNIMEAWYRNQIREKALPLINKWEETIKVRVEKLFIRRMKTRWGTCNVTKQTIRLNTLLAMKPVQCLEYIIVHEMTHILEPSHNGRFKGLMDTFLPEWKQSQKMLNQNPLV
ncbi:MAG: M48 family metallopeptidase, partial [Desulfonatronovibrio sp.]